MRKKLAMIILFAVCLTTAFLYYIHSTNITILNPKGTIASEQRNLIIVAVGLSLIVVIPVYLLTIFIVWKYRASNTSAKYSPEWDHSRILEFIWWVVPAILITILSVITWKTSYSLNPYKPIASKNKPLKVEVVALDWKWLFIYPDQNIASVNQLNIPVNTPVTFYITSDAPMNSFWIPQLSGQIYAMPGMSTQLNIQATSVGNYTGWSANISGDGFSSMHFTTVSTSQLKFNDWVHFVRADKDYLNIGTYNNLARPSYNNPVTYYGSVQNELYNQIVLKYMGTVGPTQAIM